MLFFPHITFYHYKPLIFPLKFSLSSLRVYLFPFFLCSCTFTLLGISRVYDQLTECKSDKKKERKCFCSMWLSILCMSFFILFSVFCALLLTNFVFLFVVFFNDVIHIIIIIIKRKTTVAYHKKPIAKDRMA